MTELQEQNEIKKEYLNSYKKVCCKLKNLEDQLQAIRESKSSVQAVVITDMPRGSNQSDLSDYIVKVDKISTKIIKAKQECLNVKIDIESKITDMEDGIECDILRKRYLEDKKWEEICVEIGYSWMQTHRLHSNALKNFDTK